MLRSDYCNLAGLSDRALTDLGECPYDQGGYFIINGSEKVLIAQVRRHWPQDGGAEGLGCVGSGGTEESPREGSAWGMWVPLVCSA